MCNAFEGNISLVCKSKNNVWVFIINLQLSLTACWMTTLTWRIEHKTYSGNVGGGNPLTPIHEGLYSLMWINYFINAYKWCHMRWISILLLTQRLIPVKWMKVFNILKSKKPVSSTLQWGWHQRSSLSRSTRTILKILKW